MSDRRPTVHGSSGRPSLISRLRGAADAAMSAFNVGAQPQVPFNAASMGRRLSGWRATSSGPNSIVQSSSPELVRRSRDAKRNNPHAKRALDLIPTHMVGTGIKPRSLCSNTKVRDALTQLFADWVLVSDADGVFDFYGQQALAVAEMAEGGDTFARMRPRRLSDGLPVPLQIQLIPTEQVPLEWNQSFGNNPVTQGIERDALGKRVAYWVHTQHPNDYLNSPSGVDLTPRRVLSGDMCHLYNATRIGQMRGLPWLAAALTTLHQINAYQDAELLRKQMIANIVGFVTKVNRDELNSEELAKSWGEVLESLNSDLPVVTQEPGTMQYLDLDEDVKFNNPQDGGGNYDPFIASNYRAVAASANLLYEELTGDWKNSNDRTFRAQFNTFKRQVRQWQFGLVCFQFNQPIWNRFVDYAVASSALVVPKGVTDVDLRRVEWRPERWEYLNPKQDVEAQISEIEAKLTSRQATVAERGDDIEVIDAQIAADLAREKKLGIETKPKGKAPAAPQPQEEDA